MSRAEAREVAQRREWAKESDPLPGIRSQLWNLCGCPDCRQSPTYRWHAVAVLREVARRCMAEAARLEEGE